MYCCKRWIRVLQEGNPTQFFNGPALTVDEAPINLNEDEEEVGVEIPDNVFHSSGDAEDIANVRRLGLDVDDDNEPAPENIPNQNGSQPWIVFGKSEIY